jgi:hypothetical protein
VINFGVVMTNIDLNGIKNGVASAYHTAVAKASEWLGRAVVVIKSRTDLALPYLQDQRIAAVSLVAWTLLLCEVVNGLSYGLNKISPDQTPTQRAMRDLIDIVGGISILAAGVIGFAKYTKIPFPPLAILGISAGTVLVRTALSS